MLLRLRCFNLTWNLLCWATSLPSGGEILFRLCYHLICFVFVHIVPQIRLDQTIDTRHNFFFYIRGSDSFTTDHGPQTQLSNTQVMPVCHLLYWHRNKRRQLLLNKTMSWYNLTQTPNVQGLCVLNTRLLRICTSNSGVLYKLARPSLRLLSSSLHASSSHLNMVRVALDISLAVQRHVLGHDGADLRVHVPLQTRANAGTESDANPA
jgi:hypothetical protein